MTWCALCASAIDPSRASYSSDGRLVCKACDSQQVIQAGTERIDESIAGQGIVGAAVAAISVGLASVFFNPFFMMSLIAAGAGVSTLLTMSRNAVYRERIGGGAWLLCGAAAVLGILLAAFSSLAWLLFAARSAY